MTCTYGRRSHAGVCLRPALFTFHFSIASESDVVVAVICHFYAFSRRRRILGKPSFSLAGVTNERINGGHAQREREASYAGSTHQGISANLKRRHRYVDNQRVKLKSVLLTTDMAKLASDSDSLESLHS